MKRLSILLSFIIASFFSFSANITWTNGNGTGIWNDAANWSAGIPGIADLAIFDASSTSNCLIDIPIDVRGISIRTGYTGTVTQGLGNTIIIRDQDFFIADGNFVGGDSNIDMLNGNFQIRGGEFVSTSASLLFDVNFVVRDSGSFVHNNGTVIYNDGVDRNINVIERDTFFNFIINPTGNNDDLVIAGGDTIVIENRLTLNQGRFRNGVVEVLDTMEMNANYDDGNSQVYFTGPTNGQVLINADVGSHAYFINKESINDTVFVKNNVGATIDWGRGGDRLAIVQGVLVLEERANLDFTELEIRTNGVFVPSNSTTRLVGSWDNQGGKFNNNNGNWIFDLNANRNYTSTVVDTFMNLNFVATGDFRLTMAADDSIYVENKLELTNGRIQTGHLLVHDTAFLYATYDDATADLWFVGNKSSNFIIEAALGNFDVFIRKDNPIDSVFYQPLTGNSLTIGETDRDLTIQEGVLSFDLVDTVNLDYGDLIIQPGAELQASAGTLNYQGNWNNQGGLFNANGGSWIWDNNGNRNYLSTEVDTFFNFNYNPTANNVALSALVDDSIYILNKLELSNGRIQTGNLLVEDTAILYSTYDDASADLWFIGSTTSNFLIEAALGNFDNFIRKDNPTDTVFFQPLTGNSLAIGETDRDLTIQEGVLSFDLADTVNLDYGDLIIQPGAELQASAGTLNYQGNWNNQGGLFNANGGSWIWDNNGNRNYLSTEVDTFFNFNYNPTANNVALSALVDDSIYILNKLELSNGRIQTGNLLVEDTAILYSTYDDASADLWFIGSTTSNFLIEAALGNFDVFIIKGSPTDTVFFQPLTGNSLTIGETDRDLTIQEGVLSFDLADTVNLDYGDLIIQPGAELQASAGTLNYQGNWNNQGGLFNANGGSWIWDNNGNRTYASTEVDTFYNFNYNPTIDRVLTLAANDSIYIENKLELTNGRVNTGHFLVLDTAYLYATYDDATAGLWFVGDVTSNFIIEAAQGNFDVFITKDTPTDTVYYEPLTGNSLTIGETDRDLTIQEGILSFDLVQTANLDYSDIFIQAGAKLQASAGTTRYQGNWNNIAGGFDSNNGTWIYDLGGDRTYTSHQVDTFFRMIFQPLSGNSDLTITTGDAFAVEQAIFLDESGLLNGSVFVLDTLEINANYDNNGSADIFFTGSADGTFISNSANGNHDIFINKSTPDVKVDFIDENGGALTSGNTITDLFVLEGRVEFPSNNPVNFNFTNLSLFDGGTFQAPSDTINFIGNWNNNSGKFEANGGSFIYINPANRSFITTEVDTFFNFTYNPNGNRILNMGSVDTIRVINQVDLVNGRIRTGFISAMGDVRVRGTYDADNLQASLQFVGPNPQSFDLTGGVAQMDGDIYFDKPVAEEVTLNSLLDIDRGGQAIYFNKGYLVTTQTNALFIDGAHPMIGANDSSFVKGPVTKRGNQTFIFPIGDTIYAPMTISSISSGSAQFRGQYFKNDPTDDTFDASSLGAGLNNVSINEYWLLDRLATGASCRVNLSWRPTSGVAVPAEITVARWNNGASQWEDQGASFVTGDFNNGSVTSPTLTTFSPFTLASTSINNPLPVTYKYFEVLKNSNSNVLEWVTLSEMNANYFDIEKSLDGEDWNSIGTTSANGNSNEEIKYEFTDLDIKSEIIYYRLKQVDFDGAVNLTEPRIVRRGNSTKDDFKIFPNPVSDDRVTISLSNPNEESMELKVISISGKVVYQKFINQSAASENQRIELETAGFSRGTYFIRIEKTSGNSTKKLIIL